MHAWWHEVRSFEVGGGKGDCGLTGRRTAVYSSDGPMLQGGGAFSGKDSSKTPPSAANAARYVGDEPEFT